MTTRQVMEEIKTMTPEERGQVAEFLRQLGAEPVQRGAENITIEQVADEIFTRHAPLMRKLAS